jgi:hypothetical protein
LTLNLYRRHKSKCKGQHKQGSFNGEFEERQKGWKKCDCPITVSGVFPGEGFQRKGSAEFEWERARMVAPGVGEGRSAVAGSDTSVHG